MDRTWNRLRILVADDYPDAADSLAMLLELWGHDVRIAHSGVAAEAIARTFRPHVALLELRLPGLDGCDLAGRLRGAWGENVRLFALTGYGDMAHRRQALASGFDCHLVKPVDPDQLWHLLAQVPPGAIPRRAAAVVP